MRPGLPSFTEFQNGEQVELIFLKQNYSDNTGTDVFSVKRGKRLVLNF